MEVPKENPRQFIFPLFQGSRGKGLQKFLGTSFLARDPMTIVTAYHNIDGQEEPFCIVDQSHGCECIVAAPMRSNKEADLALLQLAEGRLGKPLQVRSSDELGLGTDIKTLEYSDTRLEDGSPLLEPATRKGYASRRIRGPCGVGLANRWLLELSFPTLRGASGAPVISEWDGHVYGVIVGNVTHHLVPAQIENVVDENGKLLAETKFMLPQGLATPTQELVELLDVV